MEFFDFANELNLLTGYGDIYLGERKLTYSQNEMLSHINDNRFAIIYKRRQEGVSTAISIYLLWLLITNNEYAICVIGPNKHELDILARIVKRNKIFIEKSIGIFADFKLNSIEFSNNSVIYFESFKNNNVGRGRSLDLIHFSEAMNDHSDLREKMSALMPCIIFNKKGKLIFTTTNLRDVKKKYFGNSDAFVEYWCNGLLSCKRFVMTEKKINL